MPRIAKVFMKKNQTLNPIFCNDLAQIGTGVKMSGNSDLSDKHQSFALNQKMSSHSQYRSPTLRPVLHSIPLLRNISQGTSTIAWMTVKPTNWLRMVGSYFNPSSFLEYFQNCIRMGNTQVDRNSIDCRPKSFNCSQ